MFALLRDFYALVPANALRLPCDCSLNDLNTFLVNEILLSQHFQSFPPSPQYQKRFWKFVIQTLEELSRREQDIDFEIDQRIYHHYLSLESRPLASITSGSSSRIFLHPDPPSQSYVTHFWNLKNPLSDFNLTDDEVHKCQSITLLESRTTIESGTTGLRTWLASFVLGRYLTLNPDLVISNTILELGSGVGFLGIILASLLYHHSPHILDFVSSIWLSDVNDEVLSRCRENVQLLCNISSSYKNINYMKLDWAESVDPDESLAMATLIQENIDPDVILGADLVFDPLLIPPLIGTLKIALQISKLSDKRKLALIALTIRNEETINQFLNQARDSLLKVEEVVFQNYPFKFLEVQVCDSGQIVKIYRITQFT